MKKKHAITITAVLAASMAMSVTAFGAPTDIQGHWAQNTINKWVDKGDISGYPDGTFRPNNMITRAEFVVLVNNAMGYTKSGYAYFSDVPSHYWGKNAIQTGVAAGYISGDGNGIFRPNDPVTRQEAAAMISRILDLKQNESRAYRYTDSYAISNWAKGVVGAVSEAGIMAGYPDGSFGPNKVLTRAEAVLALDKTVNYKPGDKEEDKEETKKEDMLLTQTKLEDTTVTGDLTISDRLGTKTITLDNVTVKGKLIVDGGSEVILKDCDIKEMVMDQKDTTVKASGKTTVEKTTFKKIGKLTGGDYTDVIVDKELSGYITIDGKVRSLTLDAETDLKLGSDARIKNMEITKNADKATIDFSKGKVEDMTVKDKVTIKGSGDIDTMTVYVSGVTSSIRPDTVKTKDNASKPDYTDDDDDWSSSSSSHRNITISSDRSGGTYRNATVTKGDVTVRNMTVRENLYIDSDVKDDEVRFDGMTIYGNVYIRGGGTNSVFFEDCKISGNIYAEKTYGDKPVGLKLDNKTAQALKGTLYIRKNGADVIGLESGNATYLKQIVVDTDKLTTLDDLQADRVEIVAADADVKITASTIVKELYVTDKGYGRIDLSGTIGKLQADNNVTVKGYGRIDEKSGNVTIEPGVKIGVTSVTLDKTDLTLDVNDKATLTATVKPDDATNKTVTWKSDKPEIVEVDSNGNVTAKAAGTATITATADGKSASCKVTVNGQPATVPVQSVELNQTTLELKAGNTATLTATVNPESATDKTVTWTSDKPEIAAVEGGTVTAKAEGTAIITAKAGEQTATCTVTVTKAEVAVESVTLDKNSLELKAGNNATLTATVSPEGATNKDVTWTSDKPEIAAVEGGTVTAKAAGTAIITAKAGDKTATCTVTVAKADVAVESVTLDKTSLDLKTGDNTTLTATVNPESATNKDVTWTSDKPEIAAVEGGTVTAKAEGTATITVTTVDGGKTATCKVTVTPKTVPVSGIQVQGKGVIYVGDTTKLTATITPDGASNKAVTWDSQNKDIATVDQQGNVKALKAGTATITATAQDGSGISGSCVVTVQQADTTALKAKVTEAQALLDKTEVSAQNGTDIPPMKNWVVQKQKDDLQKAVNTANGALQQSALTAQNTVNDAYRDLQTALNAFLNAMKPGTMPNTQVPYSFWSLW
ncbi:Ig-like domain-containing protein [Anaerotignum lactatifermentans]|uniref:Ig-like domain-containing protein n=1 Tax=Anaerotignum lactatifermentans TaxID=160404 RepID=UPI002673E1F0|nr:Ig-like domain-containing protein [Anaerotignum lactatifermentans]